MSGYAVGVDLGGTNLRVAVVDNQGRMVEKLVTPTVELRTSERVIDRMCEHIQQLTGKYKGNGTLHGIGIAIPGIVDLDSGILRESPHQKRRLGFLQGQFLIPDDFDSMGATPIAHMFGTRRKRHP